MRITCLIENLGAGGAERQMAQLATLLQGRGHDVGMLVYHPADHYRHEVDKAGIPVRCVQAKRGVRRAYAIRRALQSDNPDVVVAFKGAPVFYAEIAGTTRRAYGLIVSERSHDHRGPTFVVRGRLLFHAIADAVVCNSAAQLALVRQAAPWLRGKSHLISNCVDLQRFRPKRAEPGTSSSLRLLVLGRLAFEKNATRLVEALAKLRASRCNVNVVIDWYGSFREVEPAAKAYYGKVNTLVVKYGLEHQFRMHDAQRDVLPLLHACDALCLPSLWEGFSNAVGEAIACGKPALVSHAGDNAVLVGDGENGFVFDPTSVDDIASAIARFTQLSPEERRQFGEASRRRAERLLSSEVFVDKYERLIETVAMRRRRPILYDSLPEGRERNASDHLPFQCSWDQRRATIQPPSTTNRC